MKTMFTEERKLNASDLMNLCCTKNWYTMGNNEEYSEMLKMSEVENVDTNTIVEIGTNIYLHSDWSNYDNDYSEEELIKNICHLISRISYSIFERSL